MSIQEKKDLNESASGTEPLAGDNAGFDGSNPDFSNEMPIKAKLTEEQIDELKTKASKADENWDRLLRVTADFDNFKKRAARERQDAVKFANEGLLEKLVPILDNFDMALAAAESDSANVNALRTGIKMIHSQLKSVMQEAGLEEISAQGNFDPNWHEAVSQQETTAHPEGQIIQQLRKGYKLRDRLLRPATVIIAKKPAANP